MLILVLQLNKKNLVLAEACLSNLGLQSRLPVKAEDIFNFREEYIQKRNLIAWSFVDAKSPYRQVDLLIDRSLKDIKTELISVSGRKLPVASLKSLLKMKESLDRPQDRADVVRITEKLLEKK